MRAANIVVGATEVLDQLYAAERTARRRPQLLTWMRRAFAGAFALLGARLALSER